MQYKSFDEIAGTTREMPLSGLPARLTRTQRLARWAELLEAEGGRPLQPLRDVEFVAPPLRRALRADSSPLTVAYADPLLRSDGLTGDSLGDAEDFFGLSQRKAHHLLCACHYAGRPAAMLVACRVRHAGRPLFSLGLPVLWLSLSATVLAVEAAVVVVAM